MMRIRTGYSFKTAVGHLEEVANRLKEIGWKHAPIADRNSTFGFTRWMKLAKKNDTQPVFGVELGVVPELGAKKPVIDYWTFYATNSITDLHNLIALATKNIGKEPSLLYRQALHVPGLIKICGHRVLTDELKKAKAKSDPLFHFGLSPSVSKGLFTAAMKLGVKVMATSDNFYPTSADLEFYRITLGGRANTQTYPQWILDDAEWKHSLRWITTDKKLLASALTNRDKALKLCNATLKKAKLLKPKVKKTLREMCVDGAKLKSVNLKDKVYKERLERELTLIDEKKYEDYFFIIADLIQFARARMAVGPARGSSCGSLVCYLLDITTVDPIPYGLIFERFIDINRSDLPDIDIDFSDDRRHLVFEYAEQKYGKEHVARLGTVGLFKPRSALNQAGMALRIPKWQIEKALEGLIERSSGDSRAMLQLVDTLEETPFGRKLKEEHPDVVIAGRMEGHPHNASQHAAGIVITQEPVTEYVAVDSRAKAVMCDKKDSEDLNLLKIDALGLTQLSIFERCLELIGKGGEYRYLESIPLDDQKAFDVLNNGHFAGVFQFTGGALKSLTKQIKVTHLEDMISITALARPGPMATGGANAWVKRKRGDEGVTSLHPMLTELTKETLGITIYQEQVMRIVREMGNMSWEDTSAIRKAMSGRLGNEFFERYWQKFRVGAIANGIDPDTAKQIWDQINTFGSWAFNRCICGTTKIKVANTGSNLKGSISIAELHRRYEAKPSVWIKQQKSKPWLVSLFPDDKGKPQKALHIIKSGKKLCWQYKFDDGSQVTCTPEHKFLIDGNWQPIGSAKVGDIFTSLEETPQPYTGSGVGLGHAKGKKWNIKNGDRTGLHNSAWVNGISKYKEEFKAKMKGKPCQECGKKFKRMEAHHNDFNEGRDRPKDLSWLCVGDHKRRHYEHNRRKRWQKGMRATTKVLVSRRKVGLRMTYDIEMPLHHNFALANGLVTHNSHAVAYGIVSYQCAWLKAYHPVEFAAATLDAESDPAKQITVLRELALEGTRYVPIDPERSIDKWSIARDKVKGKKKEDVYLVGPLTTIKGIGPAAVREVMDARTKGVPVRETIAKRLRHAKTSIDTLFPIRDRIKVLHPDLPSVGIVTQPTPIMSVQCGARGQDRLVIGVVVKIAPKDENEAVNIMKRGGKVLTGPTQAINLFFRDDTDEIFAKIGRYDYEELAQVVLNNGRVGKSIFALRGEVPTGFRMISVKRIKYLGELEEDMRPEKGGQYGKLNAGDQDGQD